LQLNSKNKVPLPQGGIIVRRTGKYQYVYKVLSAFRDEKGNPTNTRKMIGKLDDESGMLIPNGSYWEFYDDASILGITPSYESVRSIGATFLIGRLFNDLGVTKILQETFGDDRAMSILTAASYMVCRGNVFELVIDWCESCTFSETPLTSKSSSRLFSSITLEEKMSFFKAWISQYPCHDYLAYDVTSFSTYSTGISEAEWGYNRDKEKLQQINFGCYLEQSDGLPLFYVTYPGSIVDKSHLVYMMAYNSDLGIEDVCFVMDRGFCKAVNIQYMHSSEMSKETYVCGADIGHKANFEAVRTVREDILSMQNSVQEGIYASSVHSQFYGVTTTLHIFYDPISAEYQRRDLWHTVEAEEEMLSKLEQITKKDAKKYRNHFNIKIAENGSFQYSRDYDKIDDESKGCGYFCILSNANIGSAKVLEIYRRKDMIEKGFDDLKNHIDMKRLRTHNSTTTEGKMFCAFIALIAVSRMANLLSDYMKEKSMSKNALISELEKIKIITISNGSRLMNPITKTQRAIFEICGLSEDDLKFYITSS